MRLIMACLILCFSFKAYALPMWTYDLTGQIGGPGHAADYLRDVSKGDEFWVRMYVQPKSAGEHDVGMVGRIGDWLFSYSSAFGMYYGGDWSPERWLTQKSLTPPVGSHGPITGSSLQVTLFGFDEAGNAGWPGEDWVGKRDGWIDPSRVLRGQISLYFTGLIETAGGGVG